MADVRVRLAGPLDRDFVLETASRLADFGPPPSRPADELVSGEVRTLRAFFDSPPPGARLLVAESAGGEKLGFAYLETVVEYFVHERHGHVGMLAVTRAAQGQGVGSILVKAAEGWCREQGYRRLTLNVFEDNRGARAVYEHLGYVPETIRYVKLL